MSFLDRFKNGASSPREDLAHLKVTDARVGDVISIVGAGDDLADLDFTADRSADVEAGQRKWLELSGMYKERRVWLEVEDADEIEVRGSFDGKKYTLDDLGLSEDDLAQIDERQNPADNFEFQDKVWMYRWSREVGAFKNGQPEGAGFYCWQFQEEKGKHLLTVRKYEAEPFSARVQVQVNPGDVTVYRGQ